MFCLEEVGGEVMCGGDGGDGAGGGGGGGVCMSM
jgi:hypothetical protein